MRIDKPNHNRRVPKASIRNKFSKEVRSEVLDRENGLCQECGGQGTELHHVRLKSQSGRGVATNAMLICHTCHTHLHSNYERLRYWQYVFEEEYGSDYYKDSWD